MTSNNPKQEKKVCECNVYMGSHDDDHMCRSEATQKVKRNDFPLELCIDCILPGDINYE